jgi:rfaE bifunctional protein kinase chain/domain
MTTREILEAFCRLRVLVVGDVCLDRWCTYDPQLGEPSRETGIPRIGVVSTDVTPGAGGTVANNLVALGVKHVAVLGACGDDGFGYELFRAMQGRGMSTDLMVRSSTIPTFTYTKLLNARTGVEDLPRVDFIVPRDMPSEIEERTLATLEGNASDFDVILVSDQTETETGGLVTRKVRDALSAIARRQPGTVVWTDSRKRGELFRNVILKMNRDEADAAVLRAGVKGFEALKVATKSPVLLVTEGPEGVQVFDSAIRRVSTKHNANPVDVCGAGDSFSAGAALALCVTREAALAARIGNLVASITIMKKGTGTASPDEVLKAEDGWPV